jgi:hypothetical protein
VPQCVRPASEDIHPTTASLGQPAPDVHNGIVNTAAFSRAAGKMPGRLSLGLWRLRALIAPEYAGLWPVCCTAQCGRYAPIHSEPWLHPSVTHLQKKRTRSRIVEQRKACPE